MCFIWVGYGPHHKHLIRLIIPFNNKHSNLGAFLRTGIFLLHFTAVIYKYCNKLEFLSLASLSSLLQFLWVRPGAYPRVEYQMGASSCH
jgi:hypothetical protein